MKLNISFFNGTKLLIKFEREITRAIIIARRSIEVYTKYIWIDWFYSGFYLFLEVFSKHERSLKKFPMFGQLKLE